MDDGINALDVWTINTNDRHASRRSEDSAGADALLSHAGTGLTNGLSVTEQGKLSSHDLAPLLPGVETRMTAGSDLGKDVPLVRAGRLHAATVLDDVFARGFVLTI